MERVSSYVIPVKPEEQKGKYLLIQGCTGAIDVVQEKLALKLKDNDLSDFSENTLQILRKRGYITNKTREKEVEHVERIAHALHKRDEILYKSFTFKKILTYKTHIYI